MLGTSAYTLTNNLLTDEENISNSIKNLIGNNPAALQTFLQAQQLKIYDTVSTQKLVSFEKLYGDLDIATDDASSVVMHGIRNEESTKLNNKLLEEANKTSDNLRNTNDLANRKYEMNEWTVNNKKDTLFVFSMLFIMISGLILVTGLYRLHVISTSFWMLLSVPMILIFVLTVIYRSQYTNVYRNKRYWNRKRFEGKSGTIPMPNCANVTQGLSEAANKASGFAPLSSLSQQK